MKIRPSHRSLLLEEPQHFQQPLSPLLSTLLFLVQYHSFRNSRFNKSFWPTQILTLTSTFGFLFMVYIFHPPETSTVAPVTKLASSDAKKATTLATSSGLPTRFQGVFSMIM